MSTPAVAVITIAASDVAVASRSEKPTTRTRSGTTTMPPPTPKKAEKTPAASPMATRRTDVSYEHGQSGRARGTADRRCRNRAVEHVRTDAAQRNRDVSRPARHAALPEPALRRLLGCAGERRPDAMR